MAERDDNFEGAIGADTRPRPSENREPREDEETEGPTPLTDDEVITIVKGEISMSIGYDDHTYRTNQEEALDYYFNNPRGDEQIGRSKVQSSDVADVIEWILPDIIEAFTSTDTPVSFDAVGKEDQRQAMMESDYVNYVLEKENDSFLLYYQWFKDALLQRNGTTKTIWNESIDLQYETYEGLTEIGLAELLEGDSETEVEPIEADVQVIEEEDPRTGQVFPLEIFKVRVKTARKMGKADVCNVPPEEFLINADHWSLNVADARFTAQHTFKYSSDLIQEGFDQALVDRLPSYMPKDNKVSQARHGTERYRHRHSTPVDPSTREIEIFECYMKIDVDQDGIAELRQITISGDTVLVNEPIEENPFACLAPIIISHRWEGMSIFDRMKQIQDLKVGILRNIMDNFHTANHQRVGIVDGNVNIDDLLSSRAGGVVRMSSKDDVFPFPFNPMAAEGFAFIEMLNQMRTERSGVGPELMNEKIMIQGDSAHGIERLMSAKEKLVGTIIRVFAETGVKRQFLLLRNLLMRHQNRQKVIELRGTFVDVDPRHWKKRNSTTVRVGLGTGDRIKQVAMLDRVQATQHKYLEMGLGDIMVTHEGVHRATVDITRAMGGKYPELYFQDPSSDRAQQALQKRVMTQKEQEVKQQQLMGAVMQVEMQTKQMAEETKRMKIVFDRLAKEKGLSQEMRQMLSDEATARTELELQYDTDVPGSTV